MRGNLTHQTQQAPYDIPILSSALLTISLINERQTNIGLGFANPLAEDTLDTSTVCAMKRPTNRLLRSVSLYSVSCIVMLISSDASSNAKQYPRLITSKVLPRIVMLVSFGPQYSNESAARQLESTSMLLSFGNHESQSFLVVIKVFSVSCKSKSDSEAPNTRRLSRISSIFSPTQYDIWKSVGGSDRAPRKEFNEAESSSQYRKHSLRICGRLAAGLYKYYLELCCLVVVVVAHAQLLHCCETEIFHVQILNHIHALTETGSFL